MADVAELRFAQALTKVAAAVAPEARSRLMRLALTWRVLVASSAQLERDLKTLRETYRKRTKKPNPEKACAQIRLNLTV